MREDLQEAVRKFQEAPVDTPEEEAAWEALMEVMFRYDPEKKRQ